MFIVKMNKLNLQIIYTTFVLVMISLFISTSSLIEVGKLFLLVVLSYMLFELTTHRRGVSVHHHFNILFSVSMVVFVLYALLLKGDLYSQVRMEFFLVSLVAFAMSMIYAPKRVRVVVPSKPIRSRKVVRKVKKTTANKVNKKTTTRKVSKKVTPKKKVLLKKKVVKKSAKKVAKNVVKKTSKNVSANRNLISFDQDYEVAYVLRKFGKRITKDNKAIVVSFGKRFKKNKSFKPHNRQSFYEYVKKFKVLSKLN